MESGTLKFNPVAMRRARDSKGWTQAQLGYAVGKRERDINRWENGHHVPSGSVVIAMAQATGKDVEFFYAETEPEDDEESSLPSLDQLLAERVEALVRRRMKELA